MGNKDFVLRMPALHSCPPLSSDLAGNVPAKSTQCPWVWSRARREVTVRDGPRTTMRFEYRLCGLENHSVSVLQVLNLIMARVTQTKILAFKRYYVIFRVQGLLTQLGNNSNNVVNGERRVQRLRPNVNRR